jgi:hypothetical protein
VIFFVLASIARRPEQQRREAGLDECLHWDSSAAIFGRALVARMPGLGSGSKGVRNFTACPWILIGSVNWRTAAAKTPDSEAMVASSCGGTGGCSGLDARSSGPEQTLAPTIGATGILGPDGALAVA